MIELLPLQMQFCEAVADIAKESLPEHWSLAGVQDVLKYDTNIYYVALDTDQDKIVGFAGIMVIADEAELLNIAMTEQYRNLGIGQQLLDKVMKAASERNACRLLLEVRQSNLTAFHFYCKNNFVEIGRRRNYYSKPTEDAIIMEKQLCG